MAAELRQQAAEQAAATIKKEISEDEFDRELANFWGDIEKNDHLQELADIQAENNRLREEMHDSKRKLTDLKPNENDSMKVS